MGMACTRATVPRCAMGGPWTGQLVACDAVVSKLRGGGADSDPEMTIMSC
jgi:hypothetical protein